MSISISQLSLIEAGKRKATPKVIDSLAKATKVPVELVDLLAASHEELDSKSDPQFAKAAHVLLKLLAPEQRTRSATRTRKTA